MNFLQRLEALTEFALQLTPAKNLLREVKADPMVQPFLVNGKIRRSVNTTSSFAPLKGGVAREHKVLGITIHKTEKNPLEVLAHEYGHVKDSEDLARHDRRIHKLVKRSSDPAFKINPKKSVEDVSQQMDRMSYSRILTRERVATLGGAESLTKAGASPSSIADYFKAINPNPKTDSFRLMHPSYEKGYHTAVKADPKQRVGGTKRIVSADISKKFYGA